MTVSEMDELKCTIQLAYPSLKSVSCGGRLNNDNVAAARTPFKFESSCAIEFPLRSLMYHPNGCFALIKASCSSILFSLTPPQWKGRLMQVRQKNREKPTRILSVIYSHRRGRRDAARVGAETNFKFMQIIFKRLVQNLRLFVFRSVATFAAKKLYFFS